MARRNHQNPYSNQAMQGMATKTTARLLKKLAAMMSRQEKNIEAKRASECDRVDSLSSPPATTMKNIVGMEMVLSVMQ